MPKCFFTLKNYLKPRTFHQTPSHGFTLIEVLVAISITAIAGVIALPGLRNFVDRQQLNNASTTLQTAINITKSNSQNKTICADTGQASTDWLLVFDSNIQFAIRALCPSLVTQNTYQLSDVQYSVTASGSPTPCSTNTLLSVNNASNQVTLYCNGLKVAAPNGLSIVISLNSNPQITKTISVNQGGIVSEN